MGVTAVGGTNAGLNTRATKLARSAFVELISRPHLDAFQQERLIPRNIDLNMRLIQSPNVFMCKSVAPAHWGQQEHCKFVIQCANLIIRTKELTNTAYKALMDLLLSQNMVHHLSRVQLKHLSMSANQTSINFDNNYTGVLPDLNVVGLVSDGDLTGGYQRNPFNYQTFGVNRIELKRNGTTRPTEGYTPNFENGQYIIAYLKFHQELECDTGDKSVCLTPSEWENGYTLYTLKISDGPIGQGTYGPWSKSATGSALLEISFAAAVNENINVIIYYQMLGRREFDKFHAVIILWVSKVDFTLER